MEVLVGTRVVRGPDWAWRDQDGGEGHIGTVAEVQIPDRGEEDESKECGNGRAPCVVTVQWDCGNRCRYRCGLGGKYDLRGFDSGPAGVVQEGEVCSSCSMDPITGIMWKCVRCLEYSICTDCYMTGKHVLEHEFDRFVTARERVRVPARGHCKRKEIRGIFKFAEVVPWCDWETQDGAEATDKTGEVVRSCSKNDSRGFVEVQWTDTDQKTIHMVGHQGKVELKCTEPTSGGYYYPEHLPLLGAPMSRGDPSAVSTGDLVRVELEAEVFQAVQEGRGGWSDIMLNVIGKIGTVVAISESGDLKIRYPENLIYSLCSEAVVKVDLPQFKAGDLVRISGDLEKVQSLQHGHGDWSDAVLLLLGEVGRVYAVYSGGDVMVMVKGKSWVFNPLCLTHVSDLKEEEESEYDPLAKWAKEDADESVKYSLTNMVKNGQDTAVVMATSLSEVKMLRDFLTKYPGKVDTVSSGRTALHVAASSGLVEPMKILLKFGANVEQQDDTSTRALHSSAYHGNEETTQLLVDAGADVNAQTLDGSTPAMFAALHGNSRALKVILKSPKVDTSLQDETGNTALHAAVMSQKLSCVLPLLDAGADPCMLNFSLMTPLHYSARMGYLPIVEAFLQRFENSVSIKDGYSHTILHCAAFQNQLDIITLTMNQRGCDVDAKNDLGQTPLHMALARGNTRSVERLVEYGASVHAVDLDGCTPLHYATSRDIMEPPSEECPIIFKLFKALFGKFIEDKTSVMYAIIAIAALLLKKGADIHLKNNSGRSAYNFMPFLATLMTVLADYEGIIEEGGYPDGSPLLRLTEKPGTRPGTKSRGGSGGYHDGPEGGTSSDYYGGGQSEGPTFMIFAPAQYGKAKTGSTGHSGTTSTRSTYESSDYTMSGGRRRGGSARGSGRSSGGSGGHGSQYQDYYDQSSYGYPGQGYYDEDYTEQVRENFPVTTSSSSSGPVKPVTLSSSSSSSTGAGSGLEYSHASTSQSTATTTSSSSSSRPAPSPPASSSPASTTAAPANHVPLSSSTATTTASSVSTAGGSTVIDDELCFMCDNTVDVKFSPCGHAAMCSECAPKAKRCPVCKTSVDGVYTTMCVNCCKQEAKVRQNCGHGMCHVCKGSPICAGCQKPD